MLCIGGPNHGKDIVADSPWFDCLRGLRRPISYCPNEPVDCTPIDVVRYTRTELWSDGHWVPIWIVL